MDYANYWASAVATADLGDTVSQSLRFRGADFFTRNFSSAFQDNVTISFWFKIVSGGSLASNNDIRGAFYRSSNVNSLYYQWDGSTSGIIQNAASTAVSTDPAVFRDPNAWYHLVYRFNDTANTHNLWINGAQLIDNVVLDNPFATGDFTIGTIPGQTGGQWTFKGYMADWYLIDGQALDPTDFGRYQEDGVWVPKNYTGTYGSNGFHLDFADSSDLGNDVSGNNNDFTTTGFDTGDVALYSPGLSANAGGTMNSLANAFDGSTGTAAYVSPTGIGMTFSPANDIAFTSLEIRPSNNNMSATFDGTTTNTPTGQYTQVATNGTINSTTPLVINVGAGLNCNLNAIRINGSTVLTDNTDNDVNLLDTPTSNYQTFNPLYPVNSSGPQRFSDANLGVDISSAHPSGYNRFFFSTLKMPSYGKWYFEHTRPLTVDSAEPALQYPFVGFTTLQDTSAAESTNTWYNNISMAGGSGYGYRHGTTTNAVYGPTQGSQVWPIGAVIGCSYDADTGDVRFYNEGTDMGLFDTLPANTDFYLSMIQIYTHGPAKFNFGQMPFVYTPPTGFEALHLNQLEEPTIKNGSDHFQAITAGPDQGVGSGERGGNWSNDYYIYLGSQNILDNGPSTTNLASTTKGMLAGAAATDGFDGDNSTYAYSSLGFAWVWRPETPLTNVTKIELRNATGETVWINGTASATTGNDTRQTFYSGSAITLETVSGLVGSTYNPSTASGFGELLINDEILVDSGPLAAAQAKFSDGLYWIKDRDNTASHQLVDTVRGTSNALKSDSNAIEATYAAPTGDCVAWCWKGGGTAVSNGNGSLTSSVSANTDAGFSIVSYTGHPSSANSTVGHGLNSAPEFVITKERGNTRNWAVYHVGSGNNNILFLNLTNAQSAAAEYWQNTDPTASVFSIGTSTYVNNSSGNYIAYCWHSVPGFSKFGKYTGNGSSDDNAFVYLGFTPALLIIKRVDSTSNWHLRDTTRATSNPDEVWIEADNSGAEGTTNAAYRIDHLSNGFKWRGSVLGASGGTYIYMAWARNPFGGENVAPATAR